MVDGPRYSFHPLERRGLLLGLDAGQLLVIAAGGVLAVVAHAALSGRTGTLAGLVVAIGGLVAALWTRHGTPLGVRALTGLVWAFRRPSRPVLDDSPTAGRATPSGMATAAPARRQPGARTTPRTCPRGIEMLHAEGLPGDPPLGVVRDHRAGSWAGVIPVRGCSFSLLDPTEQAHRLEAWRRVLGSLARPGSPITRVQWLQRSWSGDSATRAVPTGPQVGASGVDPSTSYRNLTEAAGRTMTHHQAWMVLAVRPSHHPMHAPGGHPTAITELRRELRLLGGQLRDAALEPLEPLDLPRLGHLMAGSIAPPATPTEPSTGSAWPLATEDGWSAYRADDAYHATYWIAEWPRVPVGPDFLTPLLISPARTAVSVVMAPVPADRALREARSARTADLADAQLRARAGFLQSARRDRESEGVTRREAELVDGHQEFVFSGYVTVSAEDREQLTAACAAIEHAASSARLELRRLFGRQAEAFTWTLPLGRGLR